MKRLPLVIKFDLAGPSWAEFRSTWAGQRVTLVTDSGNEWTGTLDASIVASPNEPDHAVFALRAGPCALANLIGCDAVVKAYC